MARIILRIACFVTKDAEWRNVVEHYGRTANAQLAPYGMEIGHRYGTGPIVPDEISYRGDCYYKAGDPGSMRQKCHELWPNGKGIPVIVCNYPEGDGVNGQTVKPEHEDANNGVKWLPYNPDQCAELRRFGLDAAARDDPRDGARRRGPRRRSGQRVPRAREFLVDEDAEPEACRPAAAGVFRGMGLMPSRIHGDA